MSDALWWEVLVIVGMCVASLGFEGALRFIAPVILFSALLNALLWALQNFVRWRRRKALGRNGRS